MASWATMNPADVAGIVIRYNEGNRRAESVQADAERLGMDLKTLVRRIQEINLYANVYEAMPLIAPSEQFRETVKVIQPPQQPRLTDITEAPVDSDTNHWLDWLYERWNSNPVITVMHPCDMHAPWTDEASMNLYYQILQQVQPDLIVEGSDFHDFYALTSFASDPDTAAKEGTDTLDMAEETMNQHANTTKRFAPNAQKVYIWGNHERRLIRYLISQAPTFRKRIMRDFEGIIRGAGVWYLGEVDHVRMGPLQVEHGVRHADGAIKARLIDEGGQVSIMMGHVHKESSYTIRGSDFTVKGITSGCLCNLLPNYTARGINTVSGRKWTNGTVISTFSLRERMVEFESVQFDGGKCFFRGKLLTV